jgi:hypothetical protein
MCPAVLPVLLLCCAAVQVSAQTSRRVSPMQPQPTCTSTWQYPSCCQCTCLPTPASRSALLACTCWPPPLKLLVLTVHWRHWRQRCRAQQHGECASGGAAGGRDGGGVGVGVGGLSVTEHTAYKQGRAALQLRCKAHQAILPKI